MHRIDPRRIIELAAVVGLAAGIAACTSAPRYRSQPDTPQRAAARGSAGSPGVNGVDGRAVVDAAQKYLGTPYRFGGATSDGVDCSGLVTVVFTQFGIAVPRTSRAQAHFGHPIKKSNLRPGDLVFFKTRGSRISHVGIYAGRGHFIHASTRERRVRYDELNKGYFASRFVTARRFL